VEIKDSWIGPAISMPWRFRAKAIGKDLGDKDERGRISNALCCGRKGQKTAVIIKVETFWKRQNKDAKDASG